MTSPTVFSTLLIATLLASSATARGAEVETQAPVPASLGLQEPAATTGLGSDIKAYFTAPLHWSGGEWGVFGGVLVAIGAAHHYDTQVREHFVSGNPKSDTKDLQDALPTFAVLGGTWVYAAFLDSSAGRSETWTMVEATGLSTVTTYALKLAAGRERPDQTSDPNAWGKGGAGGFPSWHATAAFAVGTVLAESGNDDYRWVRRVLGYGLGTFTAYERLKHNAHWLSDVVAGAALGAASAHFAMGRRDAEREAVSHLGVVPTPGGVMLTYTTSLD